MRSEQEIYQALETFFEVSNELGLSVIHDDRTMDVTTQRGGKS